MFLIPETQCENTPKNFIFVRDIIVPLIQIKRITKGRVSKSNRKRILF